ncbi:hypothetical protein ANANG_G00241980 [Anguilla anguilla]|uniref:Uncharacterized protein n=1 Tax=Anguilla anguilla TaxID=7936 RepID=A0A9D3LVD8_ANGAN|nr:hypothetical protein ANANG_G00241980 [Anguilla anguilla]
MLEKESCSSEHNASLLGENSRKCMFAHVCECVCVCMVCVCVCVHGVCVCVCVCVCMVCVCVCVFLALPFLAGSWPVASRCLLTSSSCVLGRQGWYLLYSMVYSPFPWSTHNQERKHTHTCTHAHTPTYTHTHTHARTHTPTYTHTHMHARTHPRTCTHARTHTRVALALAFSRATGTHLTVH